MSAFICECGCPLDEEGLCPACDGLEWGGLSDQLPGDINLITGLPDDEDEEINP